MLASILKRADYLSSVSGGGYIAGYVHSHLNKYGPLAYAGMFLTEQIDNLKNYGYYLTPGQNGWERFWSKLRMGGALVISFLLNLDLGSRPGRSPDLWNEITSIYAFIGNSPYFQAGRQVCPDWNHRHPGLLLLLPRSAPHPSLELRSSLLRSGIFIIALNALGRLVSGRK